MKLIPRDVRLVPAQAGIVLTLHSGYFRQGDSDFYRHWRQDRGLKPVFSAPSMHERLRYEEGEFPVLEDNIFPISGSMGLVRTKSIFELSGDRLRKTYDSIEAKPISGSGGILMGRLPRYLPEGFAVEETAKLDLIEGEFEIPVLRLEENAKMSAKKEPDAVLLLGPGKHKLTMEISGFDVHSQWDGHRTESWYNGPYRLYICGNLELELHYTGVSGHYEFFRSTGFWGGEKNISESFPELKITAIDGSIFNAYSGREIFPRTEITVSARIADDIELCDGWSKSVKAEDMADPEVYVYTPRGSGSRLESGKISCGPTFFKRDIVGQGCDNCGGNLKLEDIAADDGKYIGIMSCGFCGRIHVEVEL